jgi:glycerophosphoryl diester phosphodiesterase
VTVSLLRGNGPLLRIGHRGAAALAPANTMAAVEAALALGVDMVELDVLGRPDRTLVLGHSHRELEAEPAALEDVFAFLSEQSPGTGLLVDVKGGGFERELVEALRRHRLVGKAVAATNKLGTLQALQRLEPGLARSRTYPPGRLYVGGRRTFVPIVGPLRLGMRSLLPSRVEALVGEAEVSAMTLDHRLVTRAAVERCHSLGVAVLAWTVNDRAALRKLDLLGVDGVITDDPRIF